MLTAQLNAALVAPDASMISHSARWRSNWRSEPGRHAMIASADSA